MMYTISLLVHNRPGVLVQLSDLFVCGGYNIEKINAAKYKKTNFTKINIAATGNGESFESLLIQLKNMSQVIPGEL